MFEEINDGLIEILRKNDINAEIEISSYDHRPLDYISCSYKYTTATIYLSLKASLVCCNTRKYPNKHKDECVFPLSDPNCFDNLVNYIKNF